MVDKTLRQLNGGGGSWRTDGITNGALAAGQTGTLLTITAPAGKIVKLFSFISNTASQQGGISLVREGVTLENEQTVASLSGNTGGSVFAVSRVGITDSQATSARGLYFEVEGDTITISKNAGNTTSALGYAYETGRYI